MPESERPSTFEIVKAGIDESALVDVNTIGRPVGDTKSSAVWLTDLPERFFGGQSSLSFCLGELFSTFGKIHKLTVHISDDGEETLLGTALIAFHKSKHTGSHDKGDPVYDACTELDGRVRVLGKRNVRIRCEAAKFEKEGYDVKSRAKTFPCVEISNLWEYDSSRAIGWYMDIQDAIRKHVSEHCTNPFVKVNPHDGTAVIWPKGAQEAMQLGRMMNHSHFMGRKVAATLCRKERPVMQELSRKQAATMSEKLGQTLSAEEAAAAVPAVLGGDGSVPSAVAKRKPQFMFQVPEGATPGKTLAVRGPSGAMLSVTVPPGVSPGQMVAIELPEEEGSAPGAPAPPAASLEFSMTDDSAVAGPTFILGDESIVFLQGLTSKPENNGRRGVVVQYLEDVKKYQVKLEGDGRVVKLKPENVRPAAGAGPSKGPGLTEEDEQVSEAKAEAELDAEMADVQAAAEAAKNWAIGKVQHGPALEFDPNVDGFQATVCVDPSLLPKRENQEEEEEDPKPPRDRSRSRQRRMEERIAAAKERMEKAAAAGGRPKWVMTGLAPDSAAAASVAEAAALKKEPEESREELAKLSVAKLKALLKEFGKSAVGCLEKRDFVDRLKPAPKT